MFAKATRRNSLLALEKLTQVVDGRRMIVADPPLVVRVDDEIAVRQQVRSPSFNDYRRCLSLEHRLLFDRFALVDVARKVVGVGSVGTRCLMALFEAGDGTPLFLQLKQATSSVLKAPFRRESFRACGSARRRRPASDPATSDVLLGWARWKQPDGHEINFYFRGSWDEKGKIDVEFSHPKKRLAAYAGLCGETLAFAHARSGDAMMIRGYIDGEWKSGQRKSGERQSVRRCHGRVCDRYADITAQDHARLCEAI